MDRHLRNGAAFIVLLTGAMTLAACSGTGGTQAPKVPVDTGAPDPTASESTSASDTSGGKAEPTDSVLELAPCDSVCPELLIELDPKELPVSPVPGDPAEVRLGFFISVEAPTAAATVDRDQAVRGIADAVDTTNEHLGVCDIAVELEVAAVISLPEGLLDIQGNEPGSYGGHPPEGITDNVEQFDYDQNATLTPETRTLFEFGKAHTSANAISAFTVANIEYYAEGLETPAPASALSFPPNAYHRPEDFPARNSVLLVPNYRGADPLPDHLGNLPLAHELGHMLLNQGGHPIGLGPGGAFSEDECFTMQQNLATLYGEIQVIDPGRPGD